MSQPNANGPGATNGARKRPTKKQSCCGCFLLIFVMLAVLAGIGALLGPVDDTPEAVSGPSPTVSPTPTETEEEQEPTEEPAEETETPTPSPTPSPTETSESPSPSPTPTETESPTPTETATPDEGRETATVTRVIDGDTVELDDGERVRLLGMDAPEMGECHGDTATQRMIELVQGQTVTLVRDDEDRDRYDRLLRYVDVDGVDAGLTLIEEGLAVSRYDSRDGYGFHTREPDYIAADQATGMQTCAPEEPETAPEAPAGDCDPNYVPCVPVYPPDINCSDIDFAVEVIGSDVHGLDADNDGIGCEGNR